MTQSRFSWLPLQRLLLTYKLGVAGALLALLLLPFLILCHYNVPYWDDYGNAANAQAQGWLSALSELYFGWTGRYSSALWLTGLNPLTYGYEDGVGWVSLAMFLATGWAQAFVLRTLTQERLSWRAALLWSAAWLLAQLYSMPSIHGAFYWFASTVTYQVPAILTLLAPAAALRAARASSRVVQASWYGLAGLSVVGVAGSNELALLLLLWLLVALVAIAWWQKAPRRRNLWLGLLLVTLVAGAVSLLAPGNFIRLGGIDQNIPQYGPVQLLVRSVMYSIFFLTDAKHLTTLIVAPLLVSGLGYRMRRWRPAGLYLPLPLGLAIVVAGLLGCFLMLVRTWGDYPALRSLNYVWFWVLTGWLLALWAALPPADARPNPARRRWLASVRLPALACVLLMVFAGRERESWRAWSELLKDARTFKTQIANRSRVIQAAQASGQRTVVVEGLKDVYPRYVLIMGDPLNVKASSTMNLSLAKWFKVDSLKVNKLYVESFQTSRL